MHAKEVEEIRALFEKAESATDPERKFSLLEEALDLSDDFAAEQSDQPSLTVVKNLRRSHLHRLIGQLTAMRHIEMGTWFNYLKLFFFRVQPEIQEIISADPALRLSYRAFLAVWKDDLIAALQSSP